MCIVNYASAFFLVCSPDDLLVSGVDWSDMMLIPDGLGLFSFPRGNVSFNGVSLGSTAIYRTSVDYRVNGGLMLERVCLNNTWTPSATIISVGKEASELCIIVAHYCISHLQSVHQVICCCVTTPLSHHLMSCVVMTAVSVFSTLARLLVAQHNSLPLMTIV